MTTNPYDTEERALHKDRKLLTDDEFLREVERDFQKKSQREARPGVAQQDRQQRVWQSIEAGLGSEGSKAETHQDSRQAAPKQHRPFPLGARAAVAGIIMVASAVLAGVVILTTLRSTEPEPFALKGSAAGRTLALRVAPASADERGVAVKSPGEGWLVVFVRSGEVILPWVDGYKLASGTTTLHVSDHPLPSGVLWPVKGQDRRLYNVCAVAVTSRPALAALRAGVATLWPSFDSPSCLY